MRIVVIMPNWLGDAVMATPFLRGLRALYPAAHIVAAGRPLVMPVLAGLAFTNEAVEFRKGEEGRVIGRLRGEKFDLGISLPNSFRSAWMLWRGGVKQRVGYSRGGRSWLLNGRADPVRRSAHQRQADAEKSRAIDQLGGGRREIGSAFEPVPTVDYYLELLQLLRDDAAPAASRRLLDMNDRRMELAITDTERFEADAAVGQIENQKSKIENIAVVVPGANFGASKCWPAERFAALAAALADPSGDFGADVLLAGSPAEMPIIEAILAAVRAHRGRVHALPKLNGGKGVSLGALK